MIESKQRIRDRFENRIFSLLEIFIIRYNNVPLFRDLNISKLNFRFDNVEKD